MSPPAMPRTLPGRRSLRLALALLALLAAALTGVEIALFPAGDAAPLWSLVAYALVGPAYLAAGVVAWWRRPAGRLGALLCLCGGAFLASSMGNVTVPALAVVGAVTVELPIGVMLHLLLAFPAGRLPDRRSRALVAAGYVVTTVLQAPQYLFAAEGAAPAALRVADRPDVVALWRTIESAAGFVVIVLAAGVLVRRLLVADAAQRRVLAAVSGYGVFSLLFLTLSAIITRVAGLNPVVLFVTQLFVVVGLPFVFLAGVVRGRFARTAEVEELGAWLGAEAGARPSLRDALAATLGDPSLELLFWLPEDARHVDAAGGTASLPALGTGRTVVPVEVAGLPVGAIVHDAVSLPDPEPVRAAGRVVALAVERERLVAQLLAGRAALRDSRARIVESGDRERRRIARDLHDGLQSQLVVVALRAGRMAAATGDPGVAREAEELAAGVDAAITQLRDLVHGIVPSLLVDRGLLAATEELLDQLPIPSTLDASLPSPGAAPLPAAVESAGYFTVAEALTNAVKHAGASQLRVRLTRAADVLTVEVADNGCGAGRIEWGGGLRGIADRVEAFGGRLRVHSAPGRGTRLVAELPCGS